MSLLGTLGLQTRSSHACPIIIMVGADLLRVGPLRRLDKRLLPHSLHCSTVTKGASEAVAELQAMLQEANSPAEAASIQAELEQVTSPATGMSIIQASPLLSTAPKQLGSGMRCRLNLAGTTQREASLVYW